MYHQKEPTWRDVAEDKFGQESQMQHSPMGKTHLKHVLLRRLQLLLCCLRLPLGLMQPMLQAAYRLLCLDSGAMTQFQYFNSNTPPSNMHTQQCRCSITKIASRIYLLLLSRCYRRSCVRLMRPLCGGGGASLCVLHRHLCVRPVAGGCLAGILHGSVCCRAGFVHGRVCCLALFRRRCLRLLPELLLCGEL